MNVTNFSPLCKEEKASVQNCSSISSILFIFELFLSYYKPSVRVCQLRRLNLAIIFPRFVKRGRRGRVAILFQPNNSSPKIYTPSFLNPTSSILIPLNPLFSNKKTNQDTKHPIFLCFVYIFSFRDKMLFFIIINIYSSI